MDVKRSNYLTNCNNLRRFKTPTYYVHKNLKAIIRIAVATLSLGGLVFNFGISD